MKGSLAQFAHYGIYKIYMLIPIQRKEKNTSLLHYISLKELDASQKHKPFIGTYDVFVVNMSTSELMSSSNSSSNCTKQFYQVNNHVKSNHNNDNLNS